MFTDRSALITLLLCGCSPAAVGGVPLDLCDTGLYGSDGKVDGHNHEYTPAWEAWSDGAEKTRWVHLPDGTHIDASDPNAWSFPVGTRLWKEFRLGGRRIETRLLWKDSASHWSLAAYVSLAKKTDPHAGSRGTTLPEVRGRAGDSADRAAAPPTVSSPTRAPACNGRQPR
jgi:hypothetical protein